MALVTLWHFALKGHQTIVLLGGATGAVGDPSGRNSERIALTEKTLETNLRSIEGQLEKLLSTALNHIHNVLSNHGSSRGDSSHQSQPMIKNNLEWIKDLSLLEFLGSVGKIARVSTMLARDSVKQRLDSGSGISFTEFSYQLLQAYDFAQLRSRYQCTVQVGGSDQYGNIMSGIDLITRLRKHSGEDSLPKSNPDVAYGVTTPLLTTSEGEKFGKSAGNAVWLDPALTSPVEFYQTFLSLGDREVSKYLRMLTFVPIEELERQIESFEKQVDPNPRSLAKLLAQEVTLLVHGEHGLRQALLATDFLFPKDKKTNDSNKQKWTRQQLDQMFEGSPNWIELKSTQVMGQSIGEIAAISKLCDSKSEAKRLIRSGGIKLNHHPLTDPAQVLSAQDLIDSGYLLIMRGKSNSYRVIKVIDST